MFEGALLDTFLSISDDGVLSHREFVVVMKNQLVRGLENVMQKISF